MSSSVLSFGVLGIVGAWGYTSYRHMTRFNGTENYAIAFPSKFDQWVHLPPTPESLFLFEDRKDHMILRGCSSQVISDVNPTPDLTTDGLAQFYLDRTHENMPEWTAQRISDVKGKNSRFSVIERQKKDRTVLTAFTVKGNTTLMVCITANTIKPDVVAKGLNDLGKYVSQISLARTDMGGGAKSEMESGF